MYARRRARARPQFTSLVDACAGASEAMSLGVALGINAKVLAGIITSNSGLARSYNPKVFNAPTFSFGLRPARQVGLRGMLECLTQPCAAVWCRIYAAANRGGFGGDAAALPAFLTTTTQEVMEVLTGPERRRRWSVEEKVAMVRETFEPGKTVSMVARLHGVNPNQLFHWRKLYQDDSLSAVSAGEEIDAGLRAGRRAEANQRVATAAGQEDDGGGNPARSRRIRSRKKMDCALAIVAGGRPVKQVCEVLGVARSNMTVKLARPMIGVTGARRGKPTTPSWSGKSGTSSPTCRAGITEVSGAGCEASGKAKARLPPTSSASFAYTACCSRAGRCRRARTVGMTARSPWRRAISAGVLTVSRLWDMSIPSRTGQRARGAFTRSMSLQSSGVLWSSGMHQTLSR